MKNLFLTIALLTTFATISDRPLLSAPNIDVTVSDSGESAHNRIRKSFSWGMITSVLGPGHGLITLDRIPRGDDIIDGRDHFHGFYEPKSRYLAAVLDSATPLVSGEKFMRDWRRNWRKSFATPTTRKSFDTAEGLHRIELFEDGVGFLVRPDGLRGAFRYTKPAKPKGFVHVPHPQFVFHYGWGLEPIMGDAGDWRDRIRRINP